jgi:hypothetical protein
VAAPVRGLPGRGGGPRGAHGGRLRRRALIPARPPGRPRRPPRSRARGRWW